MFYAQEQGEMAIMKTSHHLSLFKVSNFEFRRDEASKNLKTRCYSYTCLEAGQMVCAYGPRDMFDAVKLALA